MGKNLILIILSILFISCSHSQIKEFPIIKSDSSIKSTNKCDCKENCVSIYYKDKFVDNITRECFEEMIKAVGIVSKTQSAENNENGYKIEIELEDNPWNIGSDEIFKTYVNIKYVDDKGNVFKKIRLKAEMKMKKEGGMSEWRILYRDVTEISTPILFILVILALLL